MIKSNSTSKSNHIPNDFPDTYDPNSLDIEELQKAINNTANESISNLNTYPKPPKLESAMKFMDTPLLVEPTTVSGMCPANYLCLPKLSRARVGMLQGGML